MDILSDPGRKLQKELDIAEYTDSDHNPMIPHTLVLEPGLRLYKIYNGYWFFGRPTVEELRLDLRAVLQRCRPDWDISSAEQQTAWAKGDKTGFYPYGRTQAQVTGRTGLITAVWQCATLCGYAMARNARGAHDVEIGTRVAS